MADTLLKDLTSKTPVVLDQLIINDVTDDSDGKVTVGAVLDIINGDINVDSAGASTYNSGSIVNADINASAAIALSKLTDSPEANATADQTNAEIKTAYEANSDTNEYSDAEQTIVNNTSNTNTGDEVAASATVSGIAELATIAEVDTGTDTVRTITPAGLAGSALQTKADSVETNADVTDLANVNAAGATTLGTVTTGTWQGTTVAVNQGGTGVTTSTGTGNTVLSSSPTLVTPALGTPASGALTNCTALPAAQVSQGTLASGMVLVAPVLGTPASGTLTNATGLPITGITSSSSAEIATLCSDETGSSLLVFNTSPTLVTPLLGTPTSGVLTNCTALPLAGLTNVAKTEIWSFAMSDETTALTTGTKLTWYAPYAFTLTDIKATVVTAPTDATLVIDVHEGGTTIMSTDKCDIETGEFSTETAATPPAITDTAIANDAKLEFIIDTIGSTVAGAGAKIYLIGYPT